MPEAEQEELLRVAESVHPMWSACSAGAQKLHGRNVLIVRGSDLVLGSIDPSVPPDRGGTRLGFRLAANLGIPAIDVWTPEGKSAALDFLKIPERHLHLP